MKSAWGSDDPTKAAFPLLHGDALSEAGHEVQIFLLGEGVSLMRKSVANAVVPVGWPPLSEVLNKIVTKKIPIYACGASSRARGVTEADLAEMATYSTASQLETMVRAIRRCVEVPQPVDRHFNWHRDDDGS